MRVPHLPRPRGSDLQRDLRQIVATVNERTAIIERLVRDVDIQFKRIAQIQADLDLIRRAWEKSRP